MARGPKDEVLPLVLWGEVADQLPIPIVLVDAQGRVVELNKAYAEFLGVDTATAVGQPVERVIKGSRLPLVLSTGQPEIASPHQYAESTGLVNRIPVWEEGKVVGCLGMVLFKDIKELSRLLKENRLLTSKLAACRRALKDCLRPKYGLADIIGTSPAVAELKREVEKLGRVRLTVLITGETGVGKELWAHALHRAGEAARGREEPFVTVNCAAIPENLLEAELFGYEEGAFTGAVRGGRPGKFQLADGGTIFLDEIGDMPFTMQAKLLRVIENAEVDAIGSEKPVPVDVRVIAATNRSLPELVAAGRFRADLYYRLNVYNLYIPPLRQHPEDIPLLAKHFLSQLYHQTGIYREADQDCLRALGRYRWPGNVRELRYTLERMAIKSDREVLEERDIPPDIREEGRALCGAPNDASDLNAILARVEEETIRRVLRETNYNKRRAAQVLGIPRSRLYRRLQGYQSGKKARTI
ncbi:sigma-54-dependent Fis family transcriptional regulator [Gelria sp. Kuro-4]|uniref:sigma-54 interaction domain-containing protein n=1 Tax=Gelria sp. Kuro-4 TaxID=2796927 RepID=UPI001BF15264|nr:sigma 54-interacting transcriptional regulator [Gelria sp. Kuro-4]BCV23744.1 sigma-54-dependent Fis family transcriptional regulator [Gelria sp. Kuro-4]